jgi:hypothetical protein
MTKLHGQVAVITGATAGMALAAANSSSPKALTSTSPAAAKTNSTTQSAKSAAMSPVYQRLG